MGASSVRTRLDDRRENVLTWFILQNPSNDGLPGARKATAETAEGDGAKEQAEVA